MLECIAVGAGGFIGAVCRYLIGLIPLNTSSSFPVKTFVINIVGSFLIGMIAAMAVKDHSFNSRLVLFLKVGICGGFTTFSSFALETGYLMENGNTAIALLYAVLSVIIGVLAVFAGQEMVR
ncbi:MAG: fluoride efflux transporter CrcB [Lachnospiraceae bacterium]|nr:fluoride efflux transporter CrcB [Lachnospiraceae bacterium]